MARDVHLGSGKLPGSAALNISSDARVALVAQAIARYLALNPAAADNCVGIAQWWLPAVGAEGTPEEVEKALFLLQERRVIEGVQVGDRQRFWRAAGKPERHAP